jgi:3-hydroxybutyryl-CoA dehydratase
MNEINQAADLKFSEITIGSIFEFNKKISKEDVLSFAKLTGDFNPLHVDEKFGENSKFKKNIVHGMFTGCLFSTLVGMHCPGKNCLYVSQTLNFKSPLFYGDTITVKGTVVSKSDALKMVTLKTEILKEGKVAVNGEAKVIVIEQNG